MHVTYTHTLNQREQKRSKTPMKCVLCAFLRSQRDAHLPGSCKHITDLIQGYRLCQYNCRPTEVLSHPSPSSQFDPNRQFPIVLRADLITWNE